MRILWLVPLLATSVALGVPAAVSGADEAGELRGDVPSGETVRQMIADSAQQKASIQADLERAQADLAAALVERDHLGEERSLIAAEIEELRRSARGLALSSFVNGGRHVGIRLLGAHGVSDLSRRKTLLDSVTEPLEEASGRLRVAASRADREMIELVGLIESLRAEIESLGTRLPELAVAEAEARAMLVIADAWDRADAAIAEGRYGFAPRAKWEKLRFCESSNNYRAVSSSGRYRGAYQFDVPTWHTVGGIGDPAEAPLAEQDARARELYALRGHQPWPVCGRHLR